ncbi:FecR family protein [Fodinibius roseus]|uniref:FecR family protein n=1 Tax=Fodinibius roseus TaxID=1194090 RepID=A0A1M5AJC3_9BACT|nr:FecR domain-containing protein [Fodinibius roseus]SHF30236.1 FecR family protein [Fodinibius roseus]
MYPEQVKNYISGSYSAEDKAFVEQWVKEKPGRQKKLKELKAVWEKTGSLRLLEEEDVTSAWYSFKTKMEEKSAPKYPSAAGHSNYYKTNYRTKKGVTSWSVLFKAAAVLLVAAGLFSVYLSEYAPTEEATVSEAPVEHTIRSERGERATFRLSDGTIATLNAGSTIRYSESFGKNTREIALEGEAYFRVNNEGQTDPFVVNTEKASVRDIGTEFNVRAYNTENTDIVVSKGRVEVSTLKDSAATGNRVTVTGGDMVRVTGENSPLVVQKADLEYALAWLDEKLMFKKEPFRDIKKRLERFYDVHITVKDSVLNSKKITASFEEEELEQVIRVLALSLNAEYEISGRTVLLKRKDQQ